MSADINENEPKPRCDDMQRDLISRAMEPGRTEDRPDLVERAAQHAAEDHAGTKRAVIHELWADQPLDTAAPAAAASVSAARPAMAATPAPKPSRGGNLQTIDWGKLRLGGLIVPNAEPTRVTEEFRIIKRPLIALAGDRSSERAPRSNIIMVSSSKPREGKTYVAINLAMSLASERDMNVLLIDADCHHPSIPDRLGIKAERGLLDVLQDRQLDLGDVLIRTDCPNLTVLPSGKRVPETTEILASQRMADLMNEISQRYRDRIVVIDTPPILSTSEASVLARQVGQVVFVVEAHATGASVVQEGVSLISVCPHISVVLNKREVGTDDGTFGGYNYYG
ncbi:MAG: polysaccharide biosynthesis tyrosine autokinase [Alphaproteobacteria bacterium]|nr:polysaccharide biosynthesis tyrosine autokinase [Alphaproteobacteria bacterium]